MRDWVATMEVHCTREGGRGKLKEKNRRQRFSETVAARSGRRGTRSSRKNSHRGAQGKKKGTARSGCPTRVCVLYFLADSTFAASTFAAASAYFLVKRSTRPAVSISFCLPVKKGWQLEQISTFSLSPLMVERVVKLWPQAQCTVTV